MRGREGLEHHHHCDLVGRLSPQTTQATSQYTISDCLTHDKYILMSYLLLMNVSAGDYKEWHSAAKIIGVVG